MGLVDLRTDLKSLRFGKDRIGGGSSNQPYKTRPIPDSLSDTDVTGGPDFLLRGGTLALRNSVRDVSRLSQMFFDFKSPNGLLFTAKQQLLSRSNVKTQASPQAFNNGIYLPTSTIAQSGVNALGVHLNKQGIDPTGLTSKTGILVQPQYSNFAFITSGNGKGVFRDLNSKVISNETNRLINLKEGKVDNITSLVSSEPFLFEYSGGPGSILGTFGKTKIKRYSDTRDAFNLLKKSQPFIDQNVATMGADEIAAQVSSKSSPKIGKDFRTTLTPPNSQYSNLSKTLDYGRENIESRVNLGNPGKKGNKSSYVIGKRDENDKKLGPLDKINALPLYSSTEGVIQDSIKNDLVKFRIGVLDNKNPTKKTYIHFRAFIDSMSDSYSSNWNSTDFVGRGEKLYRYGGGFNRSVNLSWTVVAQSKDELIPMYQKLNYLASTIAPDYSDNGYMRGNLISLTLGGWFFEQVGFIEGITYDVPSESPWEIAIPDSGESSSDTILSDSSVKEMPHMIKVTGFKFTPIQGFLPKIQKNNYAEQSFEGAEADFVSGYGRERYIMLSNGGEHKYSANDRVLADNYGTTEGGITDGNRNYIPIIDQRRVEPVNTIKPVGGTFGNFDVPNLELINTNNF